MPAIPQSDRRLEDAKALLSPVFPFRECQANQLSVEASWVLGKEYVYMSLDYFTPEVLEAHTLLKWCSCSCMICVMNFPSHVRLSPFPFSSFMCSCSKWNVATPLPNYSLTPSTSTNPKASRKAIRPTLLRDWVPAPCPAKGPLGMPLLECPAKGPLGMPLLECPLGTPKPSWNAPLGMPLLECPAKGPLGMPLLECPLECPSWNAPLGMPAKALLECPLGIARPLLECPPKALLECPAKGPLEMPRQRPSGMPRQRPSWNAPPKALLECPAKGLLECPAKGPLGMPRRPLGMPAALLEMPAKGPLGMPRQRPSWNAPPKALLECPSWNAPPKALLECPAKIGMPRQRPSWNAPPKAPLECPAKGPLGMPPPKALLEKAP
nr:MAGE-like protein 2 [Penaeus vannamei]